MAIEFNITAADKFFMGEDKIIDFAVFGNDNITPIDISGVAIEWKVRKTDKATDPALITKAIGNGLTIIGTFNPNPLTNTQRVRLIFVPADTSVLKPLIYRHSLKRMDAGNAGILSYGNFTLLQATEH